MNIAVVNYNLPDYRVSLYNYLSINLDWNIDVYTGQDDVSNDFERRDIAFNVVTCRVYEFSADLPILLYPLSLRFTPELIYSLLKKDYDIVLVNGYVSIDSQIIMKAKGLFPGSLMWVRSFPRSKMNKFLRFIKIPLIMGASAYVVTGKKSLEYLEKFGFEQDDIPVIGNPVDNSYFSQYTPDKDHQKEGVSILFVGNLSKRKGFDVLLEAFGMMDNKKNKLNIVGDGPLSNLLSTKSRCSNSAVRYFGKLNRTELTKLYREVDIFVLPSRYDLWGVVINEAMNAGLPIVTTNNVGAAGDLVVDGKNGYVVDSNDAVSLSNALTSLSNNEDLRLEMGKSSRRIISNWGLSRAAAGLHRAVDNIVSSSNNTSDHPRLS